MKKSSYGHFSLFGDGGTVRTVLGAQQGHTSLTISINDFDLTHKL